MRAFSRAFGLVAEPFVFLQLWLLGGVSNLLLARLLGELPADPMAFDPTFITHRLLPAMAVSVLMGGVGFLFCIPLVRRESGKSLGAAVGAAVSRYPFVLGAMSLVVVGSMAISMVLALVMSLLFGNPNDLLVGFAVVALTLAVFVPLALHLAFFSNLIYEGREGPLGSLGASWRLVRGRALELFGLMLAVAVISIVFGEAAEGLVRAISASYDPLGPTVALAAGLVFPYLTMVQAGIYQEFLAGAEAAAQARAEAKENPALPPEPAKPPWQGTEAEAGEEDIGSRFVGTLDDFEGLAERFEEFKRKRREEARGEDAGGELEQEPPAEGPEEEGREEG